MDEEFMKEMQRKFGEDLEMRFLETKIEVREEERNGITGPVMFGYAAVFDKLSEDLGGFREQVAKGAFAEAISNDDVRALFNHDPNYVLGRSKAGTLRMQEDDHGLYVEITPPDTRYARDLLTAMKRGDINQMSFSFRVKPGGQDWARDDNGQVVRTLKRVRLFDVSPVTFPAYPQTAIAQRSMQEFLKTIVPPEPDLSDLDVRAKQLDTLDLQTRLFQQRLKSR